MFSELTFLNEQLKTLDILIRCGPTSIFWVLLGGVFALIVNRDKLERTSTTTGIDQVKELAGV